MGAAGRASIECCKIKIDEVEMSFKIGDVVQRREDGPKMTVDQIMSASIVCTWCVDGRLFKQAFEPDKLIPDEPKTEAKPIAIGAHVQLDGAGPAWLVEGFESDRALCSRLNSSGIRYEGKFPIGNLSTAAK